MGILNDDASRVTSKPVSENCRANELLSCQCFRCREKCGLEHNAKTEEIAALIADLSDQIVELKYRIVEHVSPIKAIDRAHAQLLNAKTLRRRSELRIEREQRSLDGLNEFIEMRDEYGRPKKTNKAN